MVAGNQPSLASVNQTTGSLTVGLRNTFTQIDEFNAWLNAAGGSQFLQTELGFVQADADDIVSTIGNLDRLRQCYEGLIAITPAFPFKANSQNLWGGQ
jgi:hypothetical protein